MGWRNMAKKPPTTKCDCTACQIGYTDNLIYVDALEARGMDTVTVQPYLHPTETEWTVLDFIMSGGWNRK